MNKKKKGKDCCGGGGNDCGEMVNIAVSLDAITEGILELDIIEQLNIVNELWFGVGELLEIIDTQEINNPGIKNKLYKVLYKELKRQD